MSARISAVFVECLESRRQRTMKISVLAVGIALLAACAPSAKHNEQAREKAYAAEVTVKGFELLSDGALSMLRPEGAYFNG